MIHQIDHHILLLSRSSFHSWRIQANSTLLFAVAAILLLLANHHHLLGFQCRLGTHGCCCHVSPENLSHLSQRSKVRSTYPQEVVGQRPSLGFLGRDSRLFFLHCCRNHLLRSNSCRCFSKSQLCESVVVVGGSPVCFRPRFPFLCPGQDKRQLSFQRSPPRTRLLVCSLQQL